MSVKIVSHVPKLPDAVHVYTDGACVGNPGPMGIGIVILDPRASPGAEEIGRYIGNGTNNIAELTAIQEGLQGRPRDRPIILYTDSQYAIGVLAGGFRAKANQSLVERIRKLLTHFDQLYFVKVAAHSGIAHNERADQLARAGALRAAPPARAEAKAAEPAPAPAASVAKDPSTAALAARIEWLLCRDHQFDLPESDQQKVDLAARRGRYSALKSSSMSFEDSARLATCGWLEQVIDEFLKERAGRATRAMDVLFCRLQDGGLPLPMEAAYRRARREVAGPDAFNDGWLTAFEQGGEAAVQAFIEADEEKEAAAAGNQEGTIPW